MCMYCNQSSSRSTLSTIDCSSRLVLNETIPSLSSSSEYVQYKIQVIKQNSSKSFRTLLRKICYDFDQKHRLLIIENDQLRQCVIDIHRRLNHLLLVHREPTVDLTEMDMDEESFETRECYVFSFLF